MANWRFHVDAPAFNHALNLYEVANSSLPGFGGN
jgi:hypothetical protein